MSEEIRLLLVEDDENDAELVVRDLERGGFAVDWHRVDTEPALRQAMKQPWDIILSDFAMPRFSGLAAFEVLRSSGSETPFIFVSGALGEDRAVQAMRAGAKDYFLKGNLARLPEAVRREVTEARNRRDRQKAEQMILQEQERLALAVDATGVGVFEIRLNGGGDMLDYAGPWWKLLGYASHELPKTLAQGSAWFWSHLHHDDAGEAIEGIRAFHAGSEQRYEGEFRLRHRTGQWVDVAAFARVVSRAPDGAPERIAGVLLDLSARKHLEAQLRQAQKMEAVGQLASGVAHDFNNLLTAILSFATFAFEELPPGGPVANDIQEVLKAGRRAQSVTTQLLALSRRKAVAPRVVEVSETVQGMGRILHRLLGADIDLQITAGAAGSGRVDPDAIGQVVLNLAVNARDAMPRGGRLRLETHDVTLSPDQAASKGGAARPGDYVVLTVADSGTGMDEATMARIFEPFFTTKEAGRGTGLGLSMCREIVEQADGFIEVESTLGKGTTFRVFLPRVAAPEDASERQSSPTDLHGVEKILVAEDDEQVRALAKRVLSRAGYTVVVADNGQDALDELKRQPGKFDLLLTNLVMPIMSAPELVAEARAQHPTLPVLVMSGHNAATIAMSGLPSNIQVLQKPFMPDALMRRVRQVLDAQTVSAGGA